MRNSDEDILLLGTVVSSFVATVIDDIYDSFLFKLLKLFATCLSIYLAWSRYKTSKPFHVAVKSNDWKPTKTGLQIEIPRTTHGRGKSPTVALQKLNADDSISQIIGRVAIEPDGKIIILGAVAFDMRVEIRK